MLFSVIIPLYNNEKYFPECIASVLEQSFKDFEVIVVNDGSTDKSGQIADYYAEKNSRIKVFHQENKGVFFARSFAVSKALGEYALFLDSDDYYDKNLLSALNAVIKEKSPDIITFSAYRTDDLGSKKPFGFVFDSDTYIDTENKEKLYEQMLTYNKMNSIWNKVYKRNLFDSSFQNKVTKKVVIGEDFLYNLPLITNAKTVYFLNARLYNYRENKNSATYNFKSNVFEGFKIVYDILWGYLPVWEMDNDYGIGLYHKHFLLSISSISFYSRSRIKGKYAEYKNMLREISVYDLFNVSYKNAFSSLSFLRKIPVWMIKHRAFSLLMLCKEALELVRRFL